MTEKEKKAHKEGGSEKSDATKCDHKHHWYKEHPTGCCGESCNIHTPKRVIAYRDERFFFGFVSGLAISAIVGFIILTNGGVVSKNSARINESAATTITGVTETDWVRGNPKAEATIIEFSYIGCPSCKRFYEEVKKIVEESDGKLKWVYRHAPLDSLHADAKVKAHVVECIGEQGGNEAFWNALDILMLGEEIVSLEDPTAFVESMGVEKVAFDACMREGRYMQKIQEQSDESQKLGMKEAPFVSILFDGSLLQESDDLPDGSPIDIGYEL